MSCQSVSDGSPIFVKGVGDKWAWFEDRDCLWPFLAGGLVFRRGERMRYVEPAPVVHDNPPPAGYLLHFRVRRQFVFVK